MAVANKTERAMGENDSFRLFDRDVVSVFLIALSFIAFVFFVHGGVGQ